MLTEDDIGHPFENLELIRYLDAAIHDFDEALNHLGVRETGEDF